MTSSLYALSTSDVLLRISLALIAGLVVGFERESHGRAAGLRTTMLVCVSSALAMILSEQLFSQTAENGSAWRPDPARLAAGILTGMGFLGAGTIMRQGNLVRGITTAAVLWYVTVLGLVFGSGHFLLGLVGMGIVLIALFVLPALEGLINSDWYGTVTVTAGLDAPEDMEVRQKIEAPGVRVKKMDVEYDLEHKQKVICCQIKFQKFGESDVSQEVLRRMRSLPGVLKVKWA